MQEQSLTVYFDNSCPLCRREIAFYRQRSGADALNWVDVSNPENLPDDLTFEAANARFHARTSDGELIDGGDAFLALWRALPAFRIFGHALNVQPMRLCVNTGYDLFLKIRPRIQNLFKQSNANCRKAL